MNGMDLQTHRPQLDLAVQLRRDRVVKVRVEIGHEPEERWIVFEKRRRLRARLSWTWTAGVVEPRISAISLAGYPTT